MSNRIRASRILFFCCCLGVVALTAAVGEDSSVRYGFPKLGSYQIWVSSVPVGLDVIVGALPGGKSAGRTPLVLDRKSLANGVTVVLPKKVWGAELPEQTTLLDFTASTTHSTTIREGSADRDTARAITYRVDVPGRQAVIALFQPQSTALADWARRYPPGRNFSFEEGPLRRALELRGVSSADADLGIELLRRGGKVALKGSDRWLMAEVRPSGDVTVSASPRPFRRPPPR